MKGPRTLLCLACLAAVLSLAVGQEEQAYIDDWHEKNVQLAAELARDMRMVVDRNELETKLAGAKLALDLELARVQWEVSLTGALTHLSALDAPESGNWSQYTSGLSNKTYRYTNACQQAVQDYYSTRDRYRSRGYYDRTSQFSQDLQSALSRLQRRGGGDQPGPVIVDLAPLYLQVTPSETEVQARDAYRQAAAAAGQVYEQTLSEKRRAYKDAVKAATDAHNAGAKDAGELLASLRRAARVYETEALDAYDDLRSTCLKELRKYILMAEE